MTTFSTPARGYIDSIASSANPTLEGSDGSITLPAGYTLQLDAPAFIKLGSSDTFCLRVEQDSRLDATSPLAGWQTSIEASLQLGNLPVEPQGSIFQRLLPVIPAEFRWEITGTDNVEPEGTLWVHLLFLPPDDRPPVRVLVLARPVSFTIRSFWSLPVITASALGILGLMAGCGIGLPAILPGILQRWRKVTFVKK